MQENTMTEALLVIPPFNIYLNLELAHYWVEIKQKYVHSTLSQRGNKLVVSCIYVEVNQEIQCFVYVKCFSGKIVHPYVQFQTLDLFHPKMNLTRV